MGGGWGGEVGGGYERGGEDVVEELGGGRGDLDGVVKDGEKAEKLVSLSPLGGTASSIGGRDRGHRRRFGLCSSGGVFWACC